MTLTLTLTLTLTPNLFHHWLENEPENPGRNRAEKTSRFSMENVQKISDSELLLLSSLTSVKKADQVRVRVRVRVRSCYCCPL
jgi:hypothetical protein